MILRNLAHSPKKPDDISVTSISLLMVFRRSFPVSSKNEIELIKRLSDVTSYSKLKQTVNTVTTPLRRVELHNEMNRSPFLISRI
jgi:hypothetical protein